jgi:hypothetical protein
MTHPPFTGAYDQVAHAPPIWVCSKACDMPDFAVCYRNVITSVDPTTSQSQIFVLMAALPSAQAGFVLLITFGWAAG